MRCMQKSPGAADRGVKPSESRLFQTVEHIEVRIVILSSWLVSFWEKGIRRGHIGKLLREYNKKGKRISIEPSLLSNSENGVLPVSLTSNPPSLLSPRVIPSNLFLVLLRVTYSCVSPSLATSDSLSSFSVDQQKISSHFPFPSFLAPY